jgi:hypothetical protein
VTIFATQEITISGIYLHEVYRLFQPNSPFPEKRAVRVMKQLALVNIILITMDIILLYFEWSELWGIWCAFKSLLYSVKLKVEFAILNQLKVLRIASNNLHSDYGTDTSHGTELDNTKAIENAVIVERHRDGIYDFHGAFEDDRVYRPPQIVNGDRIKPDDPEKENGC